MSDVLIGIVAAVRILCIKADDRNHANAIASQMLALLAKRVACRVGLRARRAVKAGLGAMPRARAMINRQRTGPSQSLSTHATTRRSRSSKPSVGCLQRVVWKSRPGGCAWRIRRLLCGLSRPATAHRSCSCTEAA